MATSILRLPDVIKRTGLSRSSIYLSIELGNFPPPIALGKRSVGWIESEIEDWLQQQINNSRRAPLKIINDSSKG